MSGRCLCLVSVNFYKTFCSLLRLKTTSVPVVISVYQGRVCITPSGLCFILYIKNASYFKQNYDEVLMRNKFQLVLMQWSREKRL